MESVTKKSTKVEKEKINLHNQQLSFKTPESMKHEHEELHADLTKVINLGGEIGSTAQKVANILHPHFVREEEYATPPLGLLRTLALDDLSGDLDEAIIMTSKLKANLPDMIEEHKQIVAALEELIVVAKKSNNTEVEKFAEKLILHAISEEEMLYPAAILVGEYIKLKLFVLNN